MHIAIIGGGAAGMMAAYFAAASGAKVDLIEQNEKLGKKIYITGKGRCNITNTSEFDDFFKQIHRNPRFMYSSYAQFDNQALIHLLESYSLKTKVERGGRVFPKSDKASDVIRTLKKMMASQDVHIHLNTRVESVGQIDHRWIIKTNQQAFKCDRLIIATGGCSYPLTGSRGDGYDFARQLGHKIIKPRPGLVGFHVPQVQGSGLAGLTLKNVEIKVLNQKKTPQIFGDLLFTHQGLSGPIVLELSSLLNGIDENSILDLAIDLKPALDHEKLDRRLLREIEEGSRRQIKTMLKNLIPESLIFFVLDQVGLDGEIPLYNISRPMRIQLRDTLKSLIIHDARLGPFKEAIITCGGVSTKEVNPSTMESKHVPNLFFAGEILDLDASTGGYNLQIAFSTGALAGRSAAQMEEK